MPAETVELMRKYSLKDDGPVGIEDLRMVEVMYFDFNGAIREDGELIVHEDVAEEIGEIFGEIFEAGFRIEQIRPVYHYKGNDKLSMKANNTSAFNCRYITGDDTRFSVHAYGKAIDINPVQNPYVKGDAVLPEEGRNYLKRNVNKKGMIKAGGPVVEAFKNRGWEWGGNWKNLKDYQHFEKTIDNEK